MFSDVGNYPASRQCLVKDREMRVVHRRRSIEEKASQRPQCLSVGDVVPNEKVGARLGTQPTRGGEEKKGIYFEIVLGDFKIKPQEFH